MSQKEGSKGNRKNGSAGNASAGGEDTQAVCGRGVTGWFRKSEGTTAIEFSLLAVPFVFFVIGIIELSILFLNEAVLNGAVYDAARMIRTGQVQQSTNPEETFSDALCNYAAMLMDCTQLKYQVETVESFGSAYLDPPQVDEDGNIIVPPFDSGGISDIVIVRAMYPYPLMTPLMSTFFSDYPGNKKLLIATTVFQSEPYDFEE